MNLKRGIEKKLIFWFLALSLIPLATLGILQIRQLRESLWQATQDEIARDLSERELGLDNFFANYEHRADRMRSNPRLVQMLEAIADLGEEVEANESRDHESRDRETQNATSLVVLKKEVQAFLAWSGFFALRIKDKNGKMILQQGSTEMASGFSSVELARNKNPEKDLIFGVSSGETSTPFLGLFLPITTETGDKKEIGEVLFLADMEEIEQILSASSWPIFLFSENQKIMVQLPDIFDDNPIPPKIVEKALKGKTGIVYLDDQLIVYRHMYDTDGALILLIDRALVFAPISRLTTQFVLGGLFTIVIVILLASRASKNIVKPIKILSEGVEALAAGNLEATVSVASGDEIELLSHRFNAMVGQIKARDQALRASEESASRLFETGEDVKFFINADWQILQVNRTALKDCFGYRPEEIVGRTLHSLFLDRNIPYDKDPIRYFEAQLLRKSGDSFYADLYWTDVLDTTGQKTGALVSIRDISEKKERERALKKSFKDLTDLKYSLDQAAVVATTDLKGQILYVNDKFCEISKYSKSELIGSDHKLLSSGSHESTYIETVWRTIIQGQVWRGQFKNRAKDGSFFWFDTTIVPLLDEQRRPLQYLAIHNDITQQKHYEQEVFRLSQHDHLTQLPNRALFNDRLNQAIKINRWGSRPFAVMFIDLDRFKSVNDQLGHAIGDQLLQIVAKRLIHCLRQSDTVARIGGDEFTVLLPSVAQSEDVRLVAEKIVEALKEAYVIESHQIHLSGSIGISLFPEDGEDADTLLKNADLAMYHAKEHSKGHFTFYNTLVQNRNEGAIDLESALSFALDRAEFVLYYQAQRDLISGRITGFEALIRWNLAGEELLSPDTFIPLAEKNGLILPIGRWVLETACQQLKYWQDQGFENLSLSVNVSAVQFKQSDFVQVLEGILNESGVNAKRLILEFTESCLIQHDEALIQQLEKLKGLGVQLEIDDFGTGYSSLSYLKNFPIDGLKIDRSFVEHLPGNREDAAISTMIITLADHLGLRVTAEGIETQEQLEHLKSQGCARGQGFLISLPITVEAADRLLQEERARSYRGTEGLPHQARLGQRGISL